MLVMDKQEFIVYEDGKMVAQGAEFHGANLCQLAVKIGNNDNWRLKMQFLIWVPLQKACSRKLDISSKLGYNFKVEGDISSCSLRT